MASIREMFFMIYASLKILWIRFCRWVIVPYFMPSASRGFHKAVVIGDGLAMGIGDRVVLGSSGGVASRLDNFVSSRVSLGNTKMKRPRTKWVVANCGEVDSTSHDWLPGKPLYEKTFSEGKLADSELVIIMLGTQDILQHKIGMSDDVLNNDVPGIKEHYTQEQFCDTVINLRKMCQHLMETNPNRRVLLLDITEIRGYRVLTEGQNAEIIYRANRQIVDMVHALEKDLGHKRCQWVHGSPMKVVMRKWAANDDGVHFSSKGYLEFSRWLLDFVAGAMLQVELGWWNQDLKLGSSSDMNKTIQK
mmetsp:Transcript_4250/g.5424  ORF Transcript_4250/g.5424 Transcript_4250/m.5424 type:complete len:305 (-) Transcript_4250:140-1054(-)